MTATSPPELTPASPAPGVHRPWRRNLVIVSVILVAGVAWGVSPYGPLYQQPRCPGDSWSIATIVSSASEPVAPGIHNATVIAYESYGEVHNTLSGRCGSSNANDSVSGSYNVVSCGGASTCAGVSVGLFWPGNWYAWQNGSQQGGPFFCSESSPQCGPSGGVAFSGPGGPGGETFLCIWSSSGSATQIVSIHATQYSRYFLS